MLFSEMLGVECGEWFKVLGFDCSLFRIIYDECKKEELQIKYPEKILFEPVTINMLYAVIRVAPSGIIHLPPPLTDEQKEQLKAIWTLGGRYLAKSKNNKMLAYDVHPVRSDTGYWWNCSYIFGVPSHLAICGLVNLSDPEPFDIGKALGVGE